VTQPFRVALIALLAGGRSGVPRYTVSLARALDRVSGEFPGLELRLVTTKPGAEQIGPARVHVEHGGRVLGKPRRGPRRILAEQIAARATTADLLHFFDLTGPLMAPRRQFVTTLHDVARTYGRRSVRWDYKRFVQPWAIRRAAAVVAVSAFSRDEAVRRLGANPARIRVIHSGPGLEAQTATENADGNAPGDFLLYVGDLSRHKNLPFLIDVFERAGTPDRLILAGRPGPGYADLRRKISDSSRIVTIVSTAERWRLCSHRATKASASRRSRRWRAGVPFSRVILPPCVR
jgi:glycosyltransferase involved in cell wall biosynthesis